MELSADGYQGTEKQSQRGDRLDFVMGTAIGVLLLAIGLVVVRGDQIGIRIKGFGPTNVAASRSTVQVTFDGPIDPTSIAAHFTIDPALEGRFAANNTQAIFTPVMPFR